MLVHNIFKEIDPEEFEAKLRPMGNNGEDYTGEIEFKSPQGRVFKSVSNVRPNHSNKSFLK